MNAGDPMHSTLQFLKAWYQPLTVLVILAGAIFGGVNVLNNYNKEIAELKESARVVSTLKQRVDSYKSSIRSLERGIKDLRSRSIGAVRAGYFEFDISNLTRGYHKTEFDVKDFPVAMILGWHMTCDGKNRDIESLYVEPDTSGTWTIFVENRTSCQEIDVGVAFLDERLVLKSAHFQRERPGAGDWKELIVSNSSW